MGINDSNNKDLGDSHMQFVDQIMKYEDGLMEFQNILVAPKGEDGIDPVA